MKRTGCLLILFLFFASAFSQQHPALITGKFKGIGVAAFLKQIEGVSPYYFYYKEEDIDSIAIDLEVSDKTIEEVLLKVFDKTDIRFAIDRHNRVFITRKIKIVTSLPARGESRPTDLPANDSTMLAMAIGPKKTTRTTTENKLYEIGTKATGARPASAILSGYVRNAASGEPVINASVFIDKLNRSTATDQHGYYSLALPGGNYTLQVQGLGMKDARYQIMVFGDGKLDIELKEQITTLKEVIVSSQRTSNVKRIQLGVERLSIATIKQVPTVFGEADILRVVTTLPGVKTVGEASTGFNVRGGSADQNLILFNDATVFNPSHFFGMFSAFNPEIVKDVELYKSSIPAKYGGRLSSVLDISAREGNKKHFTGSAGIGITTSRLNIEGPIAKDKTSFIFGGRTTYANWLISLLPDPYDKAKAGFNDANLLLSHSINPKNDLYLTTYLSNDRFNLATDTNYQYNNKNISLKWKHNFNTRLLAYFTAGYDQYQYKVFSDKNKVNAYTLAFDINQANFRSDFSYLLHAKHTLTFGVHSILYKLHPGSYAPRGKESLVAQDNIDAEQALETAGYLSDRYTISPKLSLEGGIRYSLFHNLGPKQVAIYSPSIPKEPSTAIDTLWYGNRKVTQAYKAPELRFALRYTINDNFSVKAGYNSMRQYIHVLSNTTAIAPTDIWKLSDPNIRPQQGDQFAIGFYKNLKSNTIETSFEMYYKRMKDYLDYKPGAALVLNHHIETEVLQTKGKAYGAELMIKKPAGKLNGWISYTYSRILLRMNDSTIGVPVNKGADYPANYDKPHDVTMVGNFKINHRFSLSLNTTYSTGRPITLPIGRYYYAGSQRVSYSDRNAYRIPDYFRADFSMNIEGNHKVKQKIHNSWTLGIYNITGRKNPFSIYYTSENGIVNGYRLSIFGSMIPFVNYNMRF